MAMSKKYVDGGRILANGKTRTARCIPKLFNNGVHQNSRKYPEPHVPKLISAQGDNSRTSPGLFAGCKFSEPPSPSSLPLPPKHWMQTTRSSRLPFHSTKADRNDGTQQLKILLKVQA